MLILLLLQSRGSVLAFLMAERFVVFGRYFDHSGDKFGIESQSVICKIYRIWWAQTLLRQWLNVVLSRWCKNIRNDQWEFNIHFKRKMKYHTHNMMNHIQYMINLCIYIYTGCVDLSMDSAPSCGTWKFSL